MARSQHQERTRLATLTLFVGLAFGAAAFGVPEALAAGGGGGGSGGGGSSARSPEAIVQEIFKRGLRNREQALEYEEKAAASSGVEFLQARIRGEVGGFSTAAEGLATDYADLTNELLGKLEKRGVATRAAEEVVDLTDEERTVSITLEEPVNA